MALTFADTHNMIAYLTKLDASEGFEQILDFLNASVIKYALTVNPTIYVSCIKQFWSYVSLKKTNDVVRLQDLIDRRKVIITEDTVRQVLYLDDVDSIDCLPNEGIFVELARMGNVDSSSKFYMYPRFLQLVIDAQVGDLSSHTTKYTSLALTQKVFANMRRVGKGFSRVDTPLFKGMLVPQLINDYVADDVNDDVASDAAAEDEDNKIAQALEITKLKQRVRRMEKKRKLKVLGLKRFKKEVAKDAEVQGRLEESQAQVYHIDLEHANKVLITAAATTITAAPSAARRRKGVVIRDPEETTTPSVIVHFEPKSKDKGKGIMVEEPKPLKKQAHIEQDEAYARELEAELNANINWNEVIKQVKRKEKQDNAVLRYQALKRKPQTNAQAKKNMMVYLKNMAGFKIDFFKGMSYDDIRPIFKKHFNSIVGFLEKSEKELKKASKAIKRKSESSEEKAAKKHKLDEEVEELKTHLQIVSNDEDDVYTEATPLALKVPVIDYQIHTKNNKPYYKIIRADGTHQLFLSFISLLRNFDREDLEMLWQIVQERFASLKPKNFSDDFLLKTLKTMFEKPNVEAQVWKSQKVMFSFEVDVVEDFKEYTQRDYYCWLKTYNCWYKLKVLDNAAGRKLRLLEESVIVDKKMKELH
uniref:Xylulose kinase-1 n=1 Tax=Tanacetum cinerariifolium TaxID=118510 RepID=A0A699JBH4_TANCI|nr:hypothetical protein [Tanacetum cinerariifolium]